MMIDTYTGPEPPPMFGNGHVTQLPYPETDKAKQDAIDLMDVMRKFESGATRNSDEGKLDFEGFLSPQVLVEFGKYMHKNRIQADGKLRSSDNWQKGMSRETYLKSLVRHIIDIWQISRTGQASRPEDGQAVDPKDALCAVIFNAMGYLFEMLREESNADL